MSKKLLNKYEYTMETTVQGIPCIAAVTNYLKVPRWKGCASTAPSEMDYYGYSEISFILLDRKGYYAAWLEAKMTGKDEDRIIDELKEEFGL
jgi:hypothetical protein